MTRTLAQIRQQIEKLEREAENVRDKEVAGVIGRIKQAIAFYGLTPQDLFEVHAKRTGRPKALADVAADKATRKKAAAKYKDPASARTWTGHGKRPGWFVHAIEEGKTIEDLAV